MSLFSFFRRGKPNSEAEGTSGGGGRFTADRVDRKKASDQNGQDDPQLPEKKRARRRLVGSITLVLAAIIVLPMVFESKPKQPAPDLQIDIPSKDRTLEEQAQSQVQPPVATNDSTPQDTVADASAEKPAGEVAMPEQGTAPVSAPATQMASAPVPKESTQPPVVEKSQASQAAEKEKEQQRKAAEKQAQAEKEKQQKAEKQKQEKARAEDSSDPIGKMIADKTASSRPDKQVFQVAALTSQQKVTELQARLSKAGIRSHTQKIKSKNGEERIRVRVGPFSSKSEMDSTCAKLKANGLSCTTVSN